MLDCKKNASNVDTNVPSNIGRHEPSDGGVPIETDVHLGIGGISCVIKILYYGLRLKTFKCKWCINYNFSSFYSITCTG